MGMQRRTNGVRVIDHMIVDHNSTLTTLITTLTLLIMPFISCGRFFM